MPTRYKRCDASERLSFTVHLSLSLNPQNSHSHLSEAGAKASERGLPA